MELMVAANLYASHSTRCQMLLKLIENMCGRDAEGPSASIEEKRCPIANGKAAVLLQDPIEGGGKRCNDF